MESNMFVHFLENLCNSALLTCSLHAPEFVFPPPLVVITSELRMTFDDLHEKAEACKAEANSYFKAGDFDKAIASYTKAIEHEESAIYYANRSLAYLKTECFGYALNDASKAIELDNTYIKGYYRKASANMALGKFREAQDDFEAVVRVAPGDKDARVKLTECQKIARLKAFAKAIAVDEKASLIDTVDLSSIIVEPSYDGPHLERRESPTNDESYSYIVTESFMLALLECYKKQKHLHKKYALLILREIRNILIGLPSLVEIDVPDVS
ncbi:unnamed protein product [Protopolystoma xenopodis]|uniref:PPP domain-containing protein n=1 Tax=Protopolystoma xenopodis TaxID=117903 RepID=A0A448X1E2_9PLAT|nr:unnamed protein product [Protopolystoma xenopodis]